MKETMELFDGISEENIEDNLIEIAEKRAKSKIVKI
jgi:hypothetical protein